MSLSEKLTRIRNTRGFGVHSPYAYLLARLVVKPAGGYTYYGYKEIDRVSNPETPVAIRAAARTLLRFLSHILRDPITPEGNPVSDESKKSRDIQKIAHKPDPVSYCSPIATSIFINPKSHPAFFAAIKSADSRISIISKKRDAAQARIIAARAKIFSNDEWLNLILHPGRILLISDVTEDLSSLLFHALPEGVMIKGKKNVIVIHRPEMQKISYLMDI